MCAEASSLMGIYGSARFLLNLSAVLIFSARPAAFL
jgi:hypothetical protein